MKVPVHVGCIYTLGASVVIMSNNDLCIQSCFMHAVKGRPLAYCNPTWGSAVRAML